MDLSHIQDRLQNYGAWVEYVGRAQSEVDSTSLVNVGASGTSAAIDSRGLNNLRLFITITGTATYDITVSGSDDKAGPWLPVYDNTVTQVKKTVSASMVLHIPGVTNWNQVILTRTTGTGTVSVKVQAYAG